MSERSAGRLVGWYLMVPAPDLQAKDITIRTLVREIRELADELDRGTVPFSLRAEAARELLRRMGLA